MALGQRLRVGTSEAKVEQDVKVAGLGITPETAIFTMRRLGRDGQRAAKEKRAKARAKAAAAVSPLAPGGQQQSMNEEDDFFDDEPDGAEQGVLSVCPGSNNAQVRVNGTLVAYKAGSKPGGAGDVVLRPGDRIVLGTCAHVLLVCSIRGNSSSKNNNNNASAASSNNYEQAIREVVLQRVETKDEYGRRLAGLVVNKLRLPRARAVFAATLVRALRGVFEANEVAVAMGSNKRFKVGGVCRGKLISFDCSLVHPFMRHCIFFTLFC